MTNNNQDSVNYSFGYSKSTYDTLLPYELSCKIPNVDSEHALIVRLDGRAMSSRFREEGKLYVDEYYKCMRTVVSLITRKFKEIVFAYSHNDEISLLIDMERLSDNTQIATRVEKLLPILSGYVSSLFSINIAKELKKYDDEVFSFDARIILLRKEHLYAYFHARQAYSMSGFIDRLCTFKKYDIKHTSKELKIALKRDGEKLSSYPRYLLYGIVGYYDDGEWTTNEAHEFYHHWDEYEDIISDYYNKTRRN